MDSGEVKPDVESLRRHVAMKRNMVDFFNEREKHALTMIEEWRATYEEAKGMRKIAEAEREVAVQELEAAEAESQKGE